ncbi:MAG: high light inducible protein [SAR202 cluster bacterium Io17-Chloro-G1]|nr:MAG: high light inducible protein [SAR202 cluster bacterium Io17-Chloro-G1]
MRIVERSLQIPTCWDRNILSDIRESVSEHLGGDSIPVRFIVSESSGRYMSVEVGVLELTNSEPLPAMPDIFHLAKRSWENTDSFNAVFIVPTGIGAEIGGHAGDATPVARMLAQVCDTLITHPNVVNASDVNEMPDNGLYVEGSVLSRLLMGTVGLRRTRSNRVLVALDAFHDARWVDSAINAVNAARSTYGLDTPGIVVLDEPLRLMSEYADSGRATGEVTGLDGLLRAFDRQRGRFDAVAVASSVEVPVAWHMEYFSSSGEMVNPWGGVEALLTHAASSIYNVPTAHAPMMESDEVAAVDPGVVDPRMAAEIISITFLQCVLKGLQKSPRMVTDPQHMIAPGTITASDVSCLVIPDGCIGLPTLAALEQGIPVIAVRENRNLMRNDLANLPWNEGQLNIVENYWEAAGVLAALRAGMSPDSVRRPLGPVSRITPTRAQKSDG